MVVAHTGRISLLSLCLVMSLGLACDEVYVTSRPLIPVVEDPSLPDLAEVHTAPSLVDWEVKSLTRIGKSNRYRVTGMALGEQRTNVYRVMALGGDAYGAEEEESGAVYLLRLRDGALYASSGGQRTWVQAALQAGVLSPQGAADCLADCPNRDPEYFGNIPITTAGVLRAYLVELERLTRQPEPDPFGPDLAMRPLPLSQAELSSVPGPIVSIYLLVSDLFIMVNDVPELHDALDPWKPCALRGPVRGMVIDGPFSDHPAKGVGSCMVTLAKERFLFSICFTPDGGEPREITSAAEPFLDEY